MTLPRLLSVLALILLPRPLPGEDLPRRVAPMVPFEATPLPLGQVRITGGPLRQAQDLNAQYLLALDPDRLLAGFRLRAGLDPKAESYGGWDSVQGKQLTGHFAGHYLSGVSLMYAVTADPRFKERADRLVRGLAEVQARRGDGYLGALTDPKGTDAAVIFRRIAAGDIRSGGFDLNGMWSPWYTLHKMFAGLRDAWRYTTNRTALELEIRFAGWAAGILDPLSEAQVQRMLHTEFGGMNEVLVDLYADTGNRRWLELADRFEHTAFTLPLQRHQDALAGMHGNTQVPKVLGSLERYLMTGRAADAFVAGFFWDRVVQHHTYATGGHGKDEYFGEPDRLSDRVDGRTAETCNVYNMLKLTRRLFAARPDPFYADFHERALFNHILGSIDPKEGWACYMVPVGRGVQREYERHMLDGGFTCCTGSSMESHALHGDGLFSVSPGRLWINLYTPAEARWSEAQVRFEMQTTFPDGEDATLRFQLEAPRPFTLALRRPYWSGDGFAVRVNGEPVPVSVATAGPPKAPRQTPGGPGQPPPASTYVEVARTWNAGDTVTVSLPKSLRLEALPDNPRRAALLWGPLVLAGDLGPDEGDADPSTLRSRPLQAPVLVAADRPPSEWVIPIAGRPGCFRTAGVGRDRDVDLVPFHQLHRRTYAVYWDLLTPSEWELKAVDLAAEQERQRRLELATVGFVQPGEMQSERDARMQGEDTSPDRVMGRAGRRGSKWFSFELPRESGHPLALVVTYNRDEWQDRSFRILADGVVVAEQSLERRGPLQFFDVEYPLPAELGGNGDRGPITVRFEAVGGREIGAVYGIRLIRADAPR